VAKIAQEEHGHMVLLRLFDVVDDTVLVEKSILNVTDKNQWKGAQFIVTIAGGQEEPEHAGQAQVRPQVRALHPRRSIQVVL